MESALYYIRHAIRSARRRPIIFAIGVVSLALAVGANALVFAVVDGVILRPFPFPDLPSLVGVGSIFPKLNQPLEFFESLSAPEYVDIKTGSKTLTHVAGFDLGNEHVLVDGRPERIFTAYVWDDLFTALSIRPASGRGFSSGELAGGAPVAIISHAVWARQYAARDIIGSQLRVSGKAFTIVGVMPERARVYETDLWIPMTAAADALPRNRRQFNVVARLAPGATLRDVNTELAALAKRVETVHGGAFREYQGWTLVASPWTAIDAWPFEHVAFAASTAAGVVLALVCLNLTILILAASKSRLHEMAVRLAIGAHRRHLILQVIAETILIGLAGGGLGLALAASGIEAFPRLVPGAFIPEDAELRLSGRVVLLVIGLSTFVAGFVAAAPALRLSRADVRSALQGREGRSSPDAAGQRFRLCLVAAEITLTIVVVAGAGSVGVALWRLLHVDPGFRTSNLLTMRLTLPAQRYAGDAGRVFFETLLERVGGLPDTAAATVALQYPPHVFSTSQFAVESRSGDEPGAHLRESRSGGQALPTAFHTIAGARFLETLGVPLKAGRWLNDDAPSAAPLEVVLNQAAADRYFGDVSPLGKRIRIVGAGFENRWAEIVGIAASVRNRGSSAEPQPELFTSLRQAPERRRSQLFLIVRSNGARDALSSIRRIVAGIDPEQPVYGVSSVQAGFSNGLLSRRIAARLLAIFGLLAIGMAALGVYGTLSHIVAERRKEIGLRLSLGAQPRDVLVMVLRQSLAVASAGASVGGGLSFALNQWVSSRLFGVRAEIMTIVIASAVTVAIALLASTIPALRASRVNPLAALRQD
jgi:predicted permease